MPLPEIVAGKCEIYPTLFELGSKKSFTVCFLTTFATLY
jgi:hypothetical protein